MSRALRRSADCPCECSHALLIARSTNRQQRALSIVELCLATSKPADKVEVISRRAYGFCNFQDCGQISSVSFVFQKLRPAPAIGEEPSNAITEGLHNKMEVVSRRAYGFRNFQNYRLRVRALCG